MSPVSKYIVELVNGFTGPSFEQVAPEVDDSHDYEYVCTRSGHDFCDGDCKRCDERAAYIHEDNMDSRREEFS